VNEAGRSELLHDEGEHLGGRRQVEQNVASGVVRRPDLAHQLRQICEHRRIMEFTAQIVDALSEPSEIVVGSILRFPERSQVAPERFVVQFTPCNTDDCEFLWQQAGPMKIPERRDEQTFREISGSTEYDKNAGVCGSGLRLHVIDLTSVRRGRRIRVASPKAACRRYWLSRASGSGRRAPTTELLPALLLRSQP
jgi:hypothetical protein